VKRWKERVTSGAEADVSSLRQLGCGEINLATGPRLFPLQHLIDSRDRELEGRSSVGKAKEKAGESLGSW
jgi:hypothetical protein